jgi:hypothetical protein
MKYKIYNQDVIEWAEQYQKGKFHALISDTPYHLTSIVKRFGKKNSSPAKHGTDGVFSRSSKGFMGQQWDGGDIAFRHETWEALGEHLYPGAFGMCFSASRNWHRLAVAIEDAGMIIHPTIFGWLNGQGFPKATNISKQIDKRPKASNRLEEFAGVLKERRKSLGISLSKADEMITDGSTMYNFLEGRNLHGELVIYPPNKKHYSNIAKYFELSGWDDIVENNLETVGTETGNFGYQKNQNRWTEQRDVQVTTTSDAEIWEGHRYGLQALKPAVEPIIVFQKPYEGKPLDNIVQTGAGALNIDGGRIAVDAPVTINRFTNGAKPWGDAKGEEFDTVLTSQGRWPANFILDNSSAELLDAQTGILTSGKPSGKKHADNNIYGKYKNEDIAVKGIGDSGGASRFFYNVSEQIDEADPIYYCGKVSPKERNAGLDEYEEIERRTMGTGMVGVSGDRTSGKGTPIEMGVTKTRNPHPTLKPIALARYLATLLLPPEEYAPRRILIPFSGVASEMIGAALAGWEQIVGIEFDTENGYVDLAHKRMEYWTK